MFLQADGSTQLMLLTVLFMLTVMCAVHLEYDKRIVCMINHHHVASPQHHPLTHLWVQQQALQRQASAAQEHLLLPCHGIAAAEPT
jgi:hypothetical protein